MKILLINNSYPDDKYSNKSTYIVSIKECLEEAGNVVQLLVSKPNNGKISHKLFNYFLFYIKLFFFNKYSQYNLIYINHFPFCFPPLIFHMKKMQNIVIHWHGRELFPEGFLHKLLLNISFKYLNPQILHIVPSLYLQKILQSKVNTSKVVISPSGGVDSQIFNLNKDRTKIDKYSVINLGFASELSKEKGLDLIEVLLKDLPNIEKLLNKRIIFHCIIYGSGKNEFLAKYSNSTGIKPWPAMPKNAMVKFYENINILLFPTSGESLGLVAIEAICCGVPVVGTNDFALTEYILPGINGELFTKGNYEEFKNAIILCIHKLNSYQTGPASVTTYLKNTVVENYRNILLK